MEGIIDFCINLAKDGGYEGIFLGMFLEGTTVPLPIEELILPLSGYFVFKGEMSFVIVVLIGALGTTVGNGIMYGLSRHLGLPFLIKYGKYFFVDEKHINKGFAIFEKHGSIIIFLGRFIPGVRGFLPIIAGISRMNPVVFFIFTFLGSFTYVTTLVSIGFALGEKWEIAIDYIIKYNQYLFVIFGIAFVIFIIYDIRKNRPFHRNVHKHIHRKVKHHHKNIHKKVKHHVKKIKE